MQNAGVAEAADVVEIILGGARRHARHDAGERRGSQDLEDIAAMHQRITPSFHAVA